MGCGGNTVQAGPPRIVVYGDLFNTETRTVLTILEMTEVEKIFKDQERTKEMMKNLGDFYDQQFSIDYISKVTPVLEEDGVKRIGSG